MIPVRWAGADEFGGAGLRGYNVEMREGSGAWSRWLTETTQTQADFPGEDGKQYTFRVQGVDQVGNAGAWLETAAVTTNAVTKYYHLAGQRVAMRQGSAIYYLHGDHLGSTSLVTDAAGATLTETRYEPYGQPYWQWGATRTDYSFTGQRLDGFGLMDYNARYYSSTLGRFVSPDTIIPQPGNPQAWDRYSYTYNNPIRFTDPSGHVACDGEFSGGDYCDSTGIGRGQKRLQSPVPQNKEPLEGPFWKAASTPGVTTPTPSYDDTVPGEIQVYKGILGLLDTASTYEDFINEAKPIYKRIKYAFPTGPFEAAVDAGLYGLTDKWSTSLTPGQRIGRMLIVGTESLIIDQISGIVGQAGNLIGGPLGGIAVNYLSSAILTDRVMPTVTWNLFDWLNLGAPAFFPRQ